MTDWLKIIEAISTREKDWIAVGLADAMPGLIANLDLTTPLRQAHFLAQCAHESDGFATCEEYASGNAYEGRKDLGNTQPGDGERFRGRGLIELTGRTNYAETGKRIGLDLAANPPTAATFPAAALTARDFWSSRNLNAYADKDDVVAVTRRVNGGTNGLSSRMAYLKRAKAALADPVNATAAADAVASAPLSKGEVAALQARLAPAYPLGKIDGQVGPLTAAAITAFQFDRGILPTTGAFDAVTVDALGDGWPALTRDEIRALQQKLADARYPVGAADGVVGRLTVQAISGFQIDNHLPITGAFDLATRSALGGRIAVASAPQPRAVGKPIGSALLRAARVVQARLAL